jgi:uncharacterized protein YdeI (YjbR/CyaY-like superfamily)
MHFADGAAFRAWLEQHHAHAEELELAFYRQGSGRGGITYAEALDEALCFGWIDGLRKKLDANRYTIRFTPRRPRSIWSLVNVRHAQRLVRAGRMREAGAKAFAARTKDRTATYSFENRPEQLPQSLARRFRADAGAWKFFSAQPPGYRRTLIWWVISAKQAATQIRRLERVISVSAGRDRVDLAAPFGSKPNQNP